LAVRKYSGPFSALHAEIIAIILHTLNRNIRKMCGDYEWYSPQSLLTMRSFKEGKTRGWRIRLRSALDYGGSSHRLSRPFLQYEPRLEGGGCCHRSPRRASPAIRPSNRRGRFIYFRKLAILSATRLRNEMNVASVDELHQTVPLSVSRSEDIDRLRMDARERFVPVR
ncbi:MAG: hypothetical protein ACLQVM_09540, partial [Terriglobia bacterium]